MFFSRNPTQGACPADNHPHDCGAIGSITGEDRSSGDIRAHRDLRSVPGAAGLIEIEGGGKVPLSVDLRLQIGDLLLRSGNGVGASDEAARRWLLARNGDGRSRKLGRITGLQAILSFPKLELLRSALVVVLDGWLGVVRRLLREEFRAEEPWVDDSGSDPEWRDLGVQRLHPALQAELRRGVGANELEVGGEGPADEEIEIMCPERCLRITGRTARVTFIGQ
jgi:hypothetical protein